MSSAPAETIPSEPILLREDRGGVATLTLNRPRVYNALSGELIGALQDALDAIAGDGSIRVVVIAAAGTTFSTGHDFREVQAARSKEFYADLFSRSAAVMRTIVALPKPVIARVQGTATAAGCQLVASCDLAVASNEARFAVSGIRYGLFCSTPSVALSRNVSRKRAFEMLMTGEFIDAETAVEYGLVNRVVAPDALDAAIEALTGSILAKSPIAVETGKRMFYRQLGMDLDAAYDYAVETMACNMMAEDAAEGVDAFLEKRPPRWKGR